MKSLYMNRILTKSTAAVLAAGMIISNAGISGINAYAANPSTGVDVEEKLYLNMDYYGDVEKANIVKGLSFSTADSHTDYGNYTSVTNMSNNQQPVIEGDAVTWARPDTNSRFYFQGGLVPESVKTKVPWRFDIKYKVNGVETDPLQVAGASGIVEIDIDAYPNKSVSEYEKNNMMLLVLIPMDSSNVYSTDAPGSIEASFGNYSGTGFEALPGQEKHFVARYGTSSFESTGVMMIMTPVTVDDLSKVKDLKEIETKYRDNTNAMMDGVESMLDHISDMSSQLDTTNKMLDELANGKGKLDQNRVIIFDGIDMSLQDLNDLNALLDPIDSSLKTSQWMVYDLNNNMNSLNSAMVSSGSVMSTLSKKLRALSDEMSTTNTYSIESVSGDLNTTKTTLKNLKTELVKGNTAVQNVAAITKSDDFDHDKTDLIDSAFMDLTEIADGNASTDEAQYLPETVLQVLESQDLYSLTKEDLQASVGNIASMLKLNTALNGVISGYGTKDSDGNLYCLTADDLAGIIYGVSVYKSTGDQTTLKNAFVSFEKNARIPDAYLTPVATAFLSGLVSDPNPTAEQTATAQTFVDHMCSMMDLDDSLDELENTNYGTSGNLKANLDNMRDYGTEALANAVSLYASVDTDTLLTDIDTAMDDIDDLLTAGATVSYQSSRLLDSLRKATSSVDALTTTLNSYYEDVQTGITNMSNLTEETEKTIADLSTTMQTLNNTLRSASEDFSKAGDDGISVGREAVENTGKIIDDTKDIKDAGADLRKTINDELDKEEEDNNFLNMDPDAKKESLTSSKNQEPSKVQIICRTEEITIKDKNEANAALADAEFPAENLTFTERIANIFRNFWSKVRSIFGK